MFPMRAAVLGSILYAFSQMPEVNVRLYRSAMRWDFDKIITPFWNTKELPYQQIHEDLPLEDDPETRIDLLIMTSLDFTLPYEGQKFMDAWDNRNRKFRMAGFIHEAYSIDDENVRKLWDELIARDTTDFYTLSPQSVASPFCKRMLKLTSTPWLQRYPQNARILYQLPASRLACAA